MITMVSFLCFLTVKKSVDKLGWKMESYIESPPFVFFATFAHQVSIKFDIPAHSGRLKPLAQPSKHPFLREGGSRRGRSRKTLARLSAR